MINNIYARDMLEIFTTHIFHARTAVRCIPVMTLVRWWRSIIVIGNADICPPNGRLRLSKLMLMLLHRGHLLGSQLHLQSHCAARLRRIGAGRSDVHHIGGLAGQRSLEAGGWNNDEENDARHGDCWWTPEV